jgi:hypothetical protein
VEQQPPVLVSQGQGLHPVHEGAGCVSACSCAGRFEGCGADRGASGEKAIRRVVQTVTLNEYHTRVNCFTIHPVLALTPKRQRLRVTS